MSDYRDKIIASQTITNDLVAELSTMLSREEYQQEDIHSVYERVRQLSDTLNEIPTKDIKL